jgi:hypothetical protein
MLDIKDVKLLAEFNGWKVSTNDYGVLFFGHKDMFKGFIEDNEISKRDFNKMYKSGDLDWQFIHQDAFDIYNWEFIMDVVKKIESIKWHPRWKVEYRVIIYPFKSMIDIGENTIGVEGTFMTIGDDRLENTIAVILQFIKWYNESKKKR